MPIFICKFIMNLFVRFVNIFTQKIVKIAKSRQTSKLIKKLKARKKYYVRVRSYKTTKIGGKTYNTYSVWSKTKKVIVKK